MHASEQSLQHTLWLWTEGAFARRVMYYLLIKGLVSSPAALLEGKTTEANLLINVIKLDPQTGGWICTNNPSDPQPAGTSNPCMRTTCTETKTSTLIHESNSILLYLEELYPAKSDQPPALKGNTLLLSAKTADLLTQINLLGMNTNYFLRNTITVHGNVMGLSPSDQSRTAALSARHWETQTLLKIQDWAITHNDFLDHHRSGGWLTPGISTNPGVVDVALAANHRFVELIYGIDMLDVDETLAPLREWYNRFRQQSWWKAFEDREDIVPEVLKGGREDRASWVKEEDGI